MELPKKHAAPHLGVDGGRGIRKHEITKPVVDMLYITPATNADACEGLYSCLRWFYCCSLIVSSRSKGEGVGEGAYAAVTERFTNGNLFVDTETTLLMACRLLSCVEHIFIDVFGSGVRDGVRGTYSIWLSRSPSLDAVKMKCCLAIRVILF